MIPPRYLALPLLLLLLPVPALAQDDAAHYRRCLQVGASQPAFALADATKWIAAHGGAPAEHCAAVALTGLKRYDEAAKRLDALARAKTTPGGMRADLFDQAGNAWMLAGQGKRAIASLQSALALDAGDPDMYADLGRAEAMMKNWNQVVPDLNAALNLRPRRDDLLLLRGSAHRALHQYAEARKDIDAALALKPGDAGILLERGLLRRDVGDLGGARSDFLAVQKSGAPDLKREAAAELDVLKD